MTDSGEQENVATIAAIATAQGRSGIGIVRVSGPLCRDISRTLVGAVPAPRTAHYATFRDAQGEALDHGLAFFYPRPASYTGEDVLELHAHGSLFTLSAVLQACLHSGAEMARPGEFTERAFLNDKIDLAQAEAVIDLINARSQAVARAALSSLCGAFSQRARELVQQLVAVRVYLEAALDFSEEEVDFLGDRELHERVVGVQQTLLETIAMAEQGRLLQEGITVVISGVPNAGKSTLLNRLVGHDAAIIADIPGTTRDVLRENLHLDGLPVTLIDTAGLRTSADPVEQEGIRRAHLEIQRADYVLHVCELGDGDPVPPEALKGVAFDTVVNKIDRRNRQPAIEREGGQGGGGVCIYLSAKTGAGMDLLRDRIKQRAGFCGTNESTFIARRRHVEALHRAREHLDHGVANLSDAAYPEIAAEDFRLAQRALQQITGEYTSDDLLGEIFASFCIGK